MAGEKKNNRLLFKIPEYQSKNKSVKGGGSRWREMNGSEGGRTMGGGSILSFKEGLMSHRGLGAAAAVN